MQTKDIDVNRISSLLEQNGLTLTEPFASSSNPSIAFNDYLYGVAQCDDDIFNLATKIHYTGESLESFFMMVRTKKVVKDFITYPKGLPQPHRINIHYSLDDLTSEVGEALNENNSKIITATEIAAEDVTHSDHIYDPSRHYAHGIVIPGVVNLRDKPFLVLSYNLQKPNENYSRCIAPVEPSYRYLVDTGVLPYHKNQDDGEGHFCIIVEGNVTRVRFLSVDIEKMKEQRLGLNLNLRFGDMEKERIEEYMDGVPLTINTDIWFDHIIGSNNRNVSLELRDINKSRNDFGNGNMWFYYNFGNDNLEEAVSKLLPHFLGVYSAFTR